MTTYQNYVNGKFVDHEGDYAQVLNPATNLVLAEVPKTSAEKANEAVAFARAAQKPWAVLPNIERAVYLHRIADLIRENREKFRDTIVAEQGKTQQLAQIEVDATADYFSFTAEWARRIEGEVIPSDRPGESIILGYRPLGVVVGILPWNFPFFLVARKVAPALLTGNTIVIKPSSDTPINAFEFAKLVDEAGVPAGVFNLVSGSGSETGQALVSNPDVNLITFTGSTAQGINLAGEAAKNLTRVNLELGGKAPAIVLADADLDVAARAIWDSRIINSGQVCNCAERVYVERSVHDQFVDKLAELFNNTVVGDPGQRNDLDYGPLINSGALESVKSAVERAVEEGAKIVTGEQSGLPQVGNFFRPVLLTEVSQDSAIIREETFGPVLPVVAVDSLDEAIELSNDSIYGLTSSIYTSNVNSAAQAARELEFGETYINRENFEATQGYHAGRKQSGIGGADGKHGLYEFLETHVTYLQTL